MPRTNRLGQIDDLERNAERKNAKRARKNKPKMRVKGSSVKELQKIMAKCQKPLK